MNSQPNVSLLIPVYNAAASLRLCLDSAAEQTLSSLEILCLDDGSADESRAILAEYARRDGRFRILEHPENRGSMAARRTLIREARGEYILFLDADDALEPDACARAWDRICRERTDIVQFGMTIDPAPGTPETLVKWFREFEKPCCRSLRGGEILSACFLEREISWNLVNKIYAAPLLKRAAEYADFPEKIVHGEDMYLTFAALSLAGSFTGFPAELYHYRYGYGVSGNVRTLEEYEKLRGEALVARRLRSLTEELGGTPRRREACGAAVELLITDSTGKLHALPFPR